MFYYPFFHRQCITAGVSEQSRIADVRILDFVSERRLSAINL
jgi:hypothetical protein